MFCNSCKLQSLTKKFWAMLCNFLSGYLSWAIITNALVSFSLRYLKCQNAKNEPSLRYKHFLISHHSFYLCSFLMTVTGILITFNGLEIFFNKGRAKLCRSSPTIFMIRPSDVYKNQIEKEFFVKGEKREQSCKLSKVNYFSTTFLHEHNASWVTNFWQHFSYFNSHICYFDDLFL